MAISSKFVIILSVLLLVSVISGSWAAGIERDCECAKQIGVCDDTCSSICGADFGRNLLGIICSPSEGNIPGKCICRYSCGCN
ncbi:hypothetical protein C2S53_018572 [Perilla frutescens var. hirtella]|uniref:Defensin-like protein n=1 Tax=Perilla frutescens var. hirtella TaxID=608512 RepID=A0AAD4IT38_PERFH|nr:hypothetical protein C2S53_018572 [Perilla frutescens var. hirtella]